MKQLTNEEICNVHSLLNRKDSAYFSFIDLITLTSEGIYQSEIKACGYLILIPLNGAILLNLNGFRWVIEKNQSFIYFFDVEDRFSIQSKNNMSEFISIFKHHPKRILKKSLISSPIQEKEKLFKLVRTDFFSLFLGKYNWYRNDELPLKNINRIWWCGALSGSFIFNEKYLEEYNSIVTRENSSIKISALSPDSMFIALDFLVE